MSQNSPEYWERRLKDRGTLVTASLNYMLDRVQQLMNMNNGLSEEEAWGVIEQEVLEQEKRLQEKIIHIIGNILAAGEGRSQGRRVVEVAVGPGHLTASLVPYALNQGYIYSGLDFSAQMLASTRDRLLKLGIPAEAIDLRQASATNLPFGELSAWLVTWGRLGLHLVEEAIWQSGLDEVKRILEPGAYFLLYEAMIEGNLHHRNCPRKEKTPTYIRERAAYEKQLYPMRLLESIFWPFCNEVYTIAVFQNDQKESL